MPPLLQVTGKARASFSIRSMVGCAVTRETTYTVTSYLIRARLCHAAGQQQQFRALGLGQRPFLDSPFTNHLRELESYHHHHHHRRKSETSSSGSGFKVPGAATTPVQGKARGHVPPQTSWPCALLAVFALTPVIF
jgi:hypothetical protein